MKLTTDELRELYTRHGFENVDVAVAVAIAESGGETTATLVVSDAQAAAYNATHPAGPRHAAEASYGLHQVNVLVWSRFDSKLLLEPDYNAQAAYLISAGGKRWTAWSTYNSGAYKAHMPATPSERPTLPDVSTAGLQASRAQMLNDAMANLPPLDLDDEAS